MTYNPKSVIGSWLFLVCVGKPCLAKLHFSVSKQAFCYLQIGSLPFTKSHFTIHKEALNPRKSVTFFSPKKGTVLS